MTVYQSVARFIFLMFPPGWKERENIILIITPRGLEADSLQDKFRDASSFIYKIAACDCKFLKKRMRISVI